MKGKHKFKVTREFITTKCVLDVIGIISHTEFYLKLIVGLLLKHSNSLNIPDKIEKVSG